MPALVGTFPRTGKAAGPCSRLVHSIGNWKVHSGFLLLLPFQTGLLMSQQDRRCHVPGEQGSVFLLTRGLQQALHCLSY